MLMEYLIKILKKFKDAQLLKNISYKEIQQILLDNSSKNQAAAGEYRIFDAVSLQILKRSNIPVLVMNGKNLNEFKKFWKGDSEVIGTNITS